METRIQNGKIMLVDDEIAICEMLSKRLAAEDFLCRTCSSGGDALEWLQREPFDLVISDLRMPGMSGLTLLEHVRSKFPHTGFIVATGVDDVLIGVQAMKQGAADYLVKPFEAEAAVRAFLSIPEDVWERIRSERPVRIASSLSANLEIDGGDAAQPALPFAGLSYPLPLVEPPRQAGHLLEGGNPS